MWEDKDLSIPKIMFCLNEKSVFYLTLFPHEWKKIDRGKVKVVILEKINEFFMVPCLSGLSWITNFVEKRTYGLVGQIATLHVRASQSKPSSGHWNLQSIINVEHDNIKIGNLTRSWSIATYSIDFSLIRTNWFFNLMKGYDDKNKIPNYTP